MDRWAIPAGQLEASVARAVVLQREIDRKERALGRKVQTLVKGLADLMVPDRPSRWAAAFSDPATSTAATTAISRSLARSEEPRSG